MESRDLKWDGDSAPSIRSIVPLGEGDFCTCYLVNETHVMRVAKHTDASASLEREICLLPKLRSHIDATVLVPKIQQTGTWMKNGQRFVFYPFIAGDPLFKETLLSFHPDRQQKLISEMASFAKQLHNFPISLARECGLIHLDPARHLPAVMRDARLHVAPLLDKTIWQYYEDLFETFSANRALQTYTPAVIHGDLSPGHFLVDSRKSALSGVIDFGDCKIGDPLWDLIFILEDYSQEILHLFLRFYEPQNITEALLRIKIYQQLDNVAYCNSTLQEGAAEKISEALQTLNQLPNTNGSMRG